MPTYDYKCTACGHRLEIFQSMKDAPKRKCPECGKNTLERLIGTGAAILFKGSGFYQTDYRSESYKKSAEADSKPATAPAANGDTSSAKPDAKPATESKPAAKPEPAKPAKKKPAKSSE
jgi:putative FmdB family regulatory protein